jgi:hypothetical protein
MPNVPQENMGEAEIEPGIAVWQSGVTQWT